MPFTTAFKPVRRGRLWGRFNYDNLIERFFNKAKQFRRIATRFNKLAENYLAVLKLVAIRKWLRGNESTS